MGVGVNFGENKLHYIFWYFCFCESSLNWNIFLLLHPVRKQEIQKPIEIAIAQNYKANQKDVVGVQCKSGVKLQAASYLI